MIWKWTINSYRKLPYYLHLEHWTYSSLEGEGFWWGWGRKTSLKPATFVLLECVYQDRKVSGLYVRGIDFASASTIFI